MRALNVDKLSPLDGIVFDFVESLPERRSRIFDDSFPADDSGISVLNSESSRCVIIIQFVA